MCILRFRRGQTAVQSQDLGRHHVFSELCAIRKIQGTISSVPGRTPEEEPERFLFFDLLAPFFLCAEPHHSGPAPALLTGRGQSRSPSNAVAWQAQCQIC